ncbi:hypothetical protein [Streptomyces fumanus]|uniref:Uncharacterized protein n=1 Tax=Streptomyces fumanus TaxID=67302 RepID=A0A919AH60_9ACTN|nr:hypothetical protein [Streptomyces fumanus]GHF06081.1 hypothetical protein GCM10018772_33750 [Streptomyces fumanus]
MTTAVLTDRERTAVRAYLRLLHTVRAAFDTPAGPSEAPRPPVIPPSVLAEAEQALAAAGLSGNEEEFFRLLASWCPRPPEPWTSSPDLEP